MPKASMSGAHTNMQACGNKYVVVSQRNCHITYYLLISSADHGWVWEAWIPALHRSCRWHNINIHFLKSQAIEYVNRKPTYSALLQGTTHHKGRFMRNHDAFIFKLCKAMVTVVFVLGNPSIVLGGVAVGFQHCIQLMQLIQ